MNWKLIVGLLLALGVGGGIWLAVKDRDRDDSQVRGGARLFPGLKRADIEDLRIELLLGDHSPTTIHARKTSGIWRLVSPLPDEADQQTLDRIANAVAGCFYSRRINSGATPAHGVDKPRVRLTFATAAGASETIRIGADAIDTARDYVQVDGRDDVYVVPNDLRIQCDRALQWYRNKVVMRVAPYDAKQVALAFAGEGSPVQLDRPDRHWTQIAPAPDRADQGLVMEFLSRVHLEARVRRFIDPPDGKPFPKGALAKYGLEAPSAPFLKLSVTPENGGPTDVVSYGTGPTNWEGKAVPGLFAFRHRDGRVFELSPEHLQPLRSAATATYFRTKELIDLNPANIDRLAVTDPKWGEWELKLEGRSWGLTRPRRLKAYERRIHALIGQFKQLTAEAFVDEPPPAGWEALGFGPKQAVRVELAVKGESEVLWLGALRPGTDKRYVRRDDTRQVYLADRKALDILAGNDRGWLSFVERKIWDTGTRQDIGNMRITIRRETGEVVSFWHRSTRPDGGVEWTAQPGTPPKAAARGATELDDLLSKLTTLHATQWHIDAPNAAALAATGLVDGPAATPNGWRARVELLRVVPGQPDRTYTLWLGGEAPEGRVYFRVAPGDGVNGDLVGTVSTAVLDTLRKLDEKEEREEKK